MITPNYQKTFNDKSEIQLEGFTINTSPHNFNHFFRQFKCSSLKPQISSWTNLQNKSEINVYEISLLFINQNVSIVSVFYLQDI